MEDYERFSRSFTQIRAEDVRDSVEAACRDGRFWPAALSPDTLDTIVPRVLELIQTSHSMRPFAVDLRYDGPPFAWHPDRRAYLCAELDAYFAHLDGLTRDELRYVLDPADVHGRDYPSETFRVLESNEIRRFDGYRTARLVLEACDRLAGVRGAA